MFQEELRQRTQTTTKTQASNANCVCLPHQIYPNSSSKSHIPAIMDAKPATFCMSHRFLPPFPYASNLLKIHQLTRRIKQHWPLRPSPLPQLPPPQPPLPSPRSVSRISRRKKNTKCKGSSINVLTFGPPSRAAYAKRKSRGVTSACSSPRPRIPPPTAGPSSISTRAACRVSGSACNKQQHNRAAALSILVLVSGLCTITTYRFPSKSAAFFILVSLPSAFPSSCPGREWHPLLCPHILPSSLLPILELLHAPWH